MVVALFNAKGLIYTNYLPRGTMVNANYIVGALGKSLTIFRQKRHVMAVQEWFFQWDNAPVHSAAVVRDWIPAECFLLLEQPPYLPELIPADFLIFPKMKNKLPGCTLTHETFYKSWEGVVRTSGKDDFTTASRRGYERCQKCDKIGNGFVEKSFKKYFL